MTYSSRRQRVPAALSILAVLLFPVVFYYLSPYLIIMGARQGIITGDALFFIGLLFSSLATGRAFCGWLCPGGAVQDLCSRVNNKKFNGRKWNLIKYYIWIPWIALIILMFAQAGGVKSVNPLYQTWNGVSVSNLPSLAIFAIVVGAIAVFAVKAGKRAMCHTVCWMAPFMIIGTKIKDAEGWPSLHLTADKSRCVSCKECTTHCPMSLNVTEMVQNGNLKDAECILCGTCVDTCPKKAIQFSFGNSK